MPFTVPVSRMSSQANNSGIGFLSLPGEARNIIYIFIISNLPSLTVSASSNKLGYTPHAITHVTSLLATNRQICYEFLSMFLHERLIITSTATLWYLESLLSLLPAQMGWSHVIDIAFLDFCTSAHSPNHAREIMDFLSNLPSLLQVTMVIRLDQLQYPILTNFEDGFAVTRSMVLKSVDQVADEYALGKLVRMRGLANINFVVMRGDNAFYSDILWLFWGLVDWLDLRLGKGVVVEVS